MFEENRGARARFHSMTDATREDWSLIVRAMQPCFADLPNRVLAHLRLLAGDHGGFAVDRLEHCLQTATRAHRDGRDEEYVVCALLHDIGDTLGPLNHAAMAAAILKPFVSEQNHWMVEQHALFQGYYFFHHLGLDRDMRDAFHDHPWYCHAEEFCRLYDAPAFDPEFQSLPLAVFEPMVHRVFASARNSIYLPKGAPDHAAGGRG